ncbi:unnamed protein product [Effrenium voratum]|nr:unnamed protein product [Effrenium voratum]
MVGTEPSWTTIPGKTGAVNHNICRAIYEKQVLESKIPWHSGYLDAPRSLSPRPRSPRPTNGVPGDASSSSGWGNDKLAKRSAASLGSCSTSSSLRQDANNPNKSAMLSSRGLWRDLPRYKNGALETTGPRSHHPAPFEMGFAGQRITAKSLVAADDKPVPRSLSPARARYLMEMYGSSPTTRELTPARIRKEKNAKACLGDLTSQVRAQSPRCVSPRQETQAFAEPPAALAPEPQIAAWMSLGDDKAHGLAEVLRHAPSPLAAPSPPPSTAFAAPAAAPLAPSVMRQPLVLPLPPRRLPGGHVARSEPVAR